MFCFVPKVDLCEVCFIWGLKVLKFDYKHVTSYEPRNNKISLEHSKTALQTHIVNLSITKDSE